MKINLNTIFDSLILNGIPLTDSERNGMIDDLVELQEKLIPYTGLLNEDIDLPTLKDKSLFTILEWQHELFAVKYFGEVEDRKSVV